MSRNPESLPTSAYDYALPPGRIAYYPAARRDDSRLLVLDRSSGAIAHRQFRDLIEYLNAGDALVLNETRVFPARLLGRKPSGARVEVLLLRRTDAADETLWEAMVRPGAKLKPGRTVDIGDALRVEIVETTGRGSRIVRLDSPLPAMKAIEKWGIVPLPPYIEREAEAQDRERYQTVYARATGSVAAPTAGLHFTPALLDEIEHKGVRVARIVLHVGPGTFQPVTVEDPTQHRLHEESYDVGDDAAALVNETRARGGRVWAVGTTVVRTLESVADEEGLVRAGQGETALFIRPPYRFRVVDRLVTNFHLPRSTLLMLVCAFGGHDAVLNAYREAVAHGYRFYSYGDAMAVV